MNHVLERYLDLLPPHQKSGILSVLHAQPELEQPMLDRITRRVQALSSRDARSLARVMSEERKMAAAFADQMKIETVKRRI